jgi:sugar phosphate isomerase/epimerase
MYYTGFADEAGRSIEVQIQATKALGWSRMESRNIDGMNVHDISDAAFDHVAEQLDRHGVRINCFGSTVANWSCDPTSEEDWQRSLQQLQRALPRMQRLGCTMIRGMSFARLRDTSLYTAELENVIFSKVRTLVKLCEDAGVMYLHENCENFGGMSSEHTLKLLDNVKSPNFRLVFDTGNPVNSMDFGTGQGNSMQNAFQFYHEVREFISYVHIKDGVFRALQPEQIFNATNWTFPGEGDGCVKEIVADLLKNGYNGGFSMEPHMAIVFHEKDSGSRDDFMRNNYVEYGHRFMKMVDAIAAETGISIAME